MKFLPASVVMLLLSGCTGVGFYPNGMSRHEWNRLSPAEQKRAIDAQNQRRSEVGLATADGAVGAAAAARAAERTQAAGFESR